MKDYTKIIKSAEDLVLAVVDGSGNPDASIFGQYPIVQAGMLKDENVKLSAGKISFREAGGSEVQKGIEIELQTSSLESLSADVDTVELMQKELPVDAYLFGRQQSHKIPGTSVNVTKDADLSGKGSRIVGIQNRTIKNSIGDLSLGKSATFYATHPTYRFNEYMKRALPVLSAWRTEQIFWALNIAGNVNVANKIYDLSPKKKQMTLYNTPTWEGASPYGLTFDGVNDYGEIASDSDFDMSGAEMVINGDIENGLTGITVDGGTVTADTVAPHSGTKSLKIVGNAGQGVRFSIGAKTVGKKYTLEFWYKLSGGSAVDIWLEGETGGSRINSLGTTATWTKVVKNLTAVATDIYLRVYCDAIGETLEVDDFSLTAAYDLSVLCWFKKLSNADDDAILGRKYSGLAESSGYWLWTPSSGISYFQFGDGVNGASVTTEGGVGLGWKFIVVTLSRIGNMIIYGVGFAVGSGSPISTIGKVVPTGYDFCIGALNTVYQLHGTIADAQVIKDRVLTAAEILNYYNATKGFYGL